jgi:hypothetical protein
MVTKNKKLSDSLSSALDLHFEVLKKSIEEKVSELANDKEPNIRDLNEAVDFYTAGNPKIEEQKPSKYEVFFSYISPFTILCAFLAIAFALLGLVNGAGSSLKGAQPGFLDISKIFAGAIVGSTSATALKAASSKKTNP